MRCSLVVVGVVSIVAGAVAPALAEEAGGAEGAEPAEPHHMNHVAVFVGGTTSLGDDSTTHFTLGADYERRLDAITHHLGIGALVDAAIGSDTETLAAGFVAVHPVTGLMLLGAAGVVFTGAGHDGAFALRGAAAYFFEVHELSVGPEVSVDRANSETAVVYGLTVGKGF